MPPDSAIGFAPADWLLALITVLFVAASFAWRPTVQVAFVNLAGRTRTCMALLFLLPIALRLLLLPHHPVPTPDIYDEFSHLLLADTLLHGRLANPLHPMHRFFETFFVLQQPTYSSIYPPGLGLVLAFGRLISGVPWTGVLITAGALCTSSYWMLRGWVAPNWALFGGLLAVMEFGPLCQWTNAYWGGSLAATGGCLVFGALPRLRSQFRTRDAILLGAGFAMHMLTREFESLMLFFAIALFFAPQILRREQVSSYARVSGIAFLMVLPAMMLLLLQNKAVTKSWTKLPEQLSQYQYGVPTSLSFEAIPTPHLPLTSQQESDYKAQSLMHGGGDSFTKFLLRLEYRVRDYRFFFLPPLYIALIACAFGWRDRRLCWIAATLALFAIGTNLFPYLLVHYLAAVTCLFLLLNVLGLQRLSLTRIRDVPVGIEIARILIVLCLSEFAFWYTLHLFETPDLYPVLEFETWDGINHSNPQRRIEVKRQLDQVKGQLLVFVRYSAHHVYQNEWVWNEADIDHSRIVYARDLGAAEDQQLVHYYPRRKILLLEPDGRVPRLSTYSGDSEGPELPSLP